MDGNDELDEDGPGPGWVHPDDRLWRHPSEVAETPWPAAFAGPNRHGLTALARGRLSAREPKVWSVALLAGVIGALLSTGLIAASGALRRNTTMVVRPTEQVILPAANVANATTMLTSSESPVVGIAAKLRPAIVELQIASNKGRSSGSGVILRSDGHILTNNHVIDGATTITVVMANGRQLKAKLVGADPDTDIAVVKIDNAGELATAPLGTAGDLKVGQQAVAIGSPLGLVGGPSVSVGVVSALGRQIGAKDGPQLLDMIQTDAPIAPGSSGGALVDRYGAVIGITTAIGVSDVGAEGLGFATPIDIARDIADQLIATGKALHVWMGVEGEDTDSSTATQLSIVGGATVKSVRGGSPAASAGIAAQDVIVAVDDQPVKSMGALVVALRSRRPGDKATIGYLRDGQPGVARVTLSERPKNL
ncbi:MAG: Peptidase [Acidimicrobiales bacterium]|nr:Peptidase [Acidimicrobiales bacterium]